MILIFFIILNEINLIKSQLTTAAAERAIKCQGWYYYKRSGRTCSICETGKYCPGDNSIYNCPTGTYSLEGASKCSPCPRGTHSNKEGSSTCEKCPAGYSSFPGRDECYQCPQGTYSPNMGSLCLICPPGEISNRGSTSCQKCPDGRYVDKGICKRCTAIWWHDNALRKKNN